jgi:hypothetical protein
VILKGAFSTRESFVRIPLLSSEKEPEAELNAFFKNS